MKSTTDLSVLYESLAKLSLGERQALFRSLDAEEKYRLFTIHLNHSLARHPEMTAEQKQVVLDSISSLSPEVYDPRDTPSTRQARERLAQIEDRGRKIFPNKLVFEVFILLGPMPETLATVCALPSKVSSSGDSEALSDLVTLYNSLENLSLGERQAMFRVSNADTKCGLFKIHLNNAKAQLSDLTEKQKQLIEESTTWLSPRFYQDSPEESPERRLLEQQAEKLFQRIQAAFPKELVVRVFGFLGPPLKEDCCPATNVVTPQSYTCTCNRNPSQDFCLLDNTCQYTGICVPTISGCGWFWNKPCNGECRQAPV